MRKNIDYYEGDDGDEQENVPLGAFELSELIEQRLSGDLEKKPKGWKKEVNGLIDEYNERFGKVYKRV